MGFIMGMDLGKLNDFTTIFILERAYVNQPFTRFPKEIRAARLDKYEEPISIANYLVRDMVRYRVDSYVTVVEDVKMRLKDPRLVRGCPLIVEANNVGIAVIDMMKAAGLSPISIWTTNGNHVTQRKDNGWNVPKRDIAQALSVVMQMKRIKWPRKHKLTAQLEKELENFTTIINQNGHITYENASDLIHDDMVMGLAIPIWWAEHQYGSIDRDTLGNKKKQYYGNTNTDPRRKRYEKQRYR
jgi:hypothetical protein